MKVLLTALFFLFVLQISRAQVTDASEQYALNATVNESSGVIYYNNKIITHNDSGNLNELYEMDLSSSTITRTVTVSGATNVDWEDMTQDDNYIYIGCIGNNNGDRTNLKIYKISKTDYNASNSVTAETINFSYANQSDFTSSPQATPWDTEALLSIDADNLLIISKNWNTHVAQAYLVSKTPGTYALSPLVSTLNDASGFGGLITGGTYNPLTNKVFLIGYTSSLSNPLKPFVYECSGFSGTDVFSGTNMLYDISGASLGNFSFEQTEGIAYVDENTYYATSEAFDTGYGIADYGKLIEITTNDSSLSINGFNTESISIYPNPTRDVVHVGNSENLLVEVYDIHAKCLLKTNQPRVNISHLNSGMYFFKITLTDKQVTVKKVLKH